MSRIVGLAAKIISELHWHLPEGYLGYPSEDLARLAEVEVCLELLKSEDDRTGLLSAVQQLKNQIGTYQRGLIHRSL